jgi:uncharacterized membrane protein YfcA
MDILNIIKILAIILCFAIVIFFFIKKQDEVIDSADKVKTAFVGFIANFFDTLGIGSFATIVAMRNLFDIMPDDVKLIGTMNVQALITSLIQTLIFLQLFKIDINLLIITIVMITIGGYISSKIATYIKPIYVHLIMLLAFILTGGLLLLSQLHLLPIYRSDFTIHGWRLIAFAIFMLFAGMLPAFGVGYYSIVRTSIFLFGLSPVVGFPIMSSASSFQMPVNSAVFIHNKKFYFKSTLILAVSGIIGVLLAAPIIDLLNPHDLRWWLLIVIFYNIITLIKNFIK